MAIVQADLVYRLSQGATSGTNNTSPGSSLGGNMATVSGAIITPSQLNNIWDDVSAVESAAGDVEYRCIYITNTHATLSLQNAVVWIDVPTTAQTDLDEAIGLDPAAIGSDSTTTVANENTAPSGVTFSSPTTKGTGLSIGTIPAGGKKAIWWRRSVTAAAAASSPTPSIRVEGDTNP